MDSSNLRIAIIGGTGKEGQGIAFRWAQTGAQVTIGSREITKAENKAERLNRILGKNPITPAQNENAVGQADIVVLAVPYDCAANALTRYTKYFRPGSILVDATVPLIGDYPMRYLESAEGSGSERLRSCLPHSTQLV